MSTCEYEYHSYPSDMNLHKPELYFKCKELAVDEGTRCIFHNINYLKGDNYEINKKKLVDKFEKKLSNHPKGVPFKFIGYCLPEIPSLNKQFDNPVYFNDTIFYGSANFSETIFLEAADFSGSKFLKEVSFNGATFNKAEFSKAMFCNKAYFKKATFCSMANFRGATFSEQADFDEAKFSEAHFFRSAFFKKADFIQAKFCRIAEFDEATFSNKTDFGAIFLEKASFNGATFNKANFDRANFSGEADFKEAKFSLANFNKTEFSKEARFESAKFSEKASFSSATFAKEANFYSAEFYEKAYFDEAKFFGVANFDEADFVGEAYFGLAEFSEKASFDSAKFSEKANFSRILIQDKAYFNYVLFEDGKKILFGEIEDLSNFSFMNTDITRVRFSDRARWGKDDKFKVTDEEKLESPNKYFLFSWDEIRPKQKNCGNLLKYLDDSGINWKDNLELIKVNERTVSNIMPNRKTDNKGSWHYEYIPKNYGNSHVLVITLNDKKTTAILTIDGKIYDKFFTRKENDRLNIYYTEKISVDSIKAIYRNLRENYEFRLRYDEAGKFFIKEMELKRKYREVLSPDGSNTIVKQNGPVRRIFSLTGLYYHLSRYGEDLLRPSLVGIAIIFGSTFFWLTQLNPTHEPSLFHNVGFAEIGNSTQWQKAFERSFADFLPLLSLGSDIKVGLGDYIIKIVGGALTFGLLAIALRRKFERKYTR
jgi:uncharacterized protein YjbI with pentapeptide repeats/uncharacterized protein YeeX (DUF496 family)